MVITCIFQQLNDVVLLLTHCFQVITPFRLRLEPFDDKRKVGSYTDVKPSIRFNLQHVATTHVFRIDGQANNENQSTVSTGLGELLLISVTYQEDSSRSIYGTRSFVPSAALLSSRAGRCSAARGSGHRPCNASVPPTNVTLGV